MVLRPLKETGLSSADERLFPRDCREGVRTVPDIMSLTHAPSPPSCDSVDCKCTVAYTFMHSSISLTSAQCMQAISYRAPLQMDVCYQMEGGAVQRFNRRFGLLPIMVKSEVCYLHSLDRWALPLALHSSCAFSSSLSLCKCTSARAVQLNMIMIEPAHSR
jgi:hypothetical protein